MQTMLLFFEEFAELQAASMDVASFFTSEFTNLGAFATENPSQDTRPRAISVSM